MIARMTAMGVGALLFVFLTCCGAGEPSKPPVELQKAADIPLGNCVNWGLGPPVDHSWNLMSVSYGGTVSLIKGLTKREAEYMKARLLGEPVTAVEKAAPDEPPGDIKTVEIFQ